MAIPARSYITPLARTPDPSCPGTVAESTHGISMLLDEARIWQAPTLNPKPL